MFKKSTAIVLAFILVLSLAPAGIAAQVDNAEMQKTTEDGLVYEVYADYVEITGYTGSTEELVIPEVIEGLPVTSIGASAFYGCNSFTSITIPDCVSIIGEFAFAWCANLTSITIPDGIKEIGDYTFGSCKSLTNIAMPNGLTSIGDSAFYGCSSLINITIPDTVTSIGATAFRDCCSLTSITIPDSVMYIGDGVFALCDNLTSIHIGEHNPYYIIDEHGVLYNKAQTNLIQSLNTLSGNYTIADSVTRIGAYAFNGCHSLTSVTIPDGITEIKFAAFAECTSLVSITIPDTVTTIREFAFEDCTSLKSITIPRSVKEMSGFAVFRNCTGLTSVTLPDSITSIGDEVFSGCSSLVDIIIPESVTSIGEYTFWGCSSLTDITIPENVISIGRFAFSDCSRLNGIYVDENNPSYSNDKQGILYNKHKTTLLQAPGSLNGYYQIPDSVSSIGRGAFAYCKNLKGVTIPTSVTSIDDFAFESCVDLKRITIPANVTSIGYNAFCDCSTLSSIIFEGNAPTMDQIFYCITATAYYPAGNKTWTADVMLDYGGTITWKEYNLQKKEYSTEIGGACSDTTNWALSDGILRISPSASAVSTASVRSAECRMADYADILETPWYPYQAHITSIVICDSVEYIGSNAFNGMENIHSVYIGANVSEIGSGAFNACSAIETITFYGDAPAMDESVFSDTSASVSYPAGNSTWDDGALEAFGNDASYVSYEGEPPAVPEPRVNPFSDVPVGSFYYEPVLWAVANNITNGTGPSAFAPTSSCNRAQAVTFLWRAEGSPAPTTSEHPFVDVEAGSFYEKAVLWAVENGITTGTDATHFNPDSPCNRATVVTFLHRAFGEPAVENGSNPFTDVPADTWYTAPVLWAVEQEITNGMGGGTFGVNDTCNRAQIVTFLYRAYI